ncbi:metabolite traffic protein EboE [Streptomyces sp. NPDC046727]|uniref:metabolite traffic protein EboE n=1 Tax=Streptomyces sp. NPDC046727 TaxID=3155373 RepID=UPI0033D91FA6
MRLRHPDGTILHLAHCTNVHPAEDLAGVLRQLDTCAEPVRARLGTDRLGLGLWLAREVSRELAADRGATDRLRRELTARGLETVTLNGFPYRGFHEPVVKKAVYRPDWTDPERLAHTLDLARVLAALLPDDAARGSISTLPLGWRTPWSARHHDAALRHLDRLAEGLGKLAVETGREIRVGLEPEPGCAVATTADACARLGGRIDPRHLGVCLDACHLAVDFEEPGPALRRLAEAGLPVVKAQLSAALEAGEPARAEVRRALAAFAEPRFLHQTRAAGAGPAPHGWDDLPLALRDTGTAYDPAGPWRVHFHIPVHADPVPPLSSTRPVLDRTIRELVAGPRAVTDHLEVETYTWSVLPPAGRPADADGLADGIAAELAWTRDRLVAAGLEALA